MDERMEVNRLRWEELVEAHVGSDFYDVEAFRAGADSLMPPEIAALGDVKGKSMLHLQCHFGMDSLSWARRGADVTGVDFSANAIAAARKLSEEVGVPAVFVQSDVLDLEGTLEDRFDIVFTSYGTIGWLPDLSRWAGVVARFLKPGGRFCMADFHPLASALDRGETPQTLRPAYSYFYSAEPDYEEEDGSYAVDDVSFAHRGSNWWNHNLGDIITALVGAGLRIDSLRELSRSPYDVHSFTEPDGEGQWRLVGGVDAVPLAYVLTASRPITGA